MIFDPWRNRVLIDYCQFITLQWLLPRSCGAPFFGSGEKYFSLVDDTEIEIMKALWEAEDYLRIPAARRVWGCSWFDNKVFWEMAALTIKDATAAIEQSSSCLSIPLLGRGLLVVLTAQFRHWESIEVKNYYQTALDCLVRFCTGTPELAYVPAILKIEEGSKLDAEQQ
jgi:hypothetical protein